MVEWLYSGLQNRRRRFDSGPSLHNMDKDHSVMSGWRNWYDVYGYTSAARDRMSIAVASPVRSTGGTKIIISS